MFFYKMILLVIKGVIKLICFILCLKICKSLLLRVSEANEFPITEFSRFLESDWIPNWKKKTSKLQLKQFLEFNENLLVVEFGQH